MKRNKHWLLRLDSRLFSRRLIPLLAVIAVLLWSAVAAAPSRTLDVHFLDIGQGDSIYGRLPTGEDFLIDGGPNEKVLSELGEVMPFWDKEINLVIATHNHADHIGGLDDVLAKFEVKEIWISGSIHTTQTYLAFLEAVKKEKEQGAIVKTVKAGDETDIGSAKLRVLFPLETKEGSRPDDQHNATIVSRLSYGNTDYLLTGDINEDHEREIFNSQFPVLNSEILKIPHHGSATGLLEEFLDAIKPKYAIFQVGANNRFGHPAPSILQKLESRAIPYYRNDQHGRVEISTDGKNIFVNTER